MIEDNLFSGDTLFAEGCGMCWGSGADPVSMFDSLQKLKQILTPNTLIFSGHSFGQAPGQPFEKILKDNIYLHFDDCTNFVAYRMHKNQQGLFNFK